jgi:hypothetical protein
MATQHQTNQPKHQDPKTEKFQEHGEVKTGQQKQSQGQKQGEHQGNNPGGNPARTPEQNETTNEARNRDRDMGSNQPKHEKHAHGDQGKSGS